MANEIRVSTSLQVRKGNLAYTTPPQRSAFTASMAGTRGPTPGVITALTSGTDVSFTAVGTPGLCEISCIDATYGFTYGVWDPDHSEYFPLGECLPGESYILRLSRFLGEEIGTGTGTANIGGTTMRLKGLGGPSLAVIQAIEQ